MKYCITIFWGELFLLLTLSTSGCHDGDKGSLWDENIVRFQVDVETDPNGRGGYNVEPDWCVLMLPENNRIMQDIPLVIYCHSGGGTVSSSGSEPENNDFTRYFVSGDVPYCVLPECLNPILNVCRWIIPDVWVIRFLSVLLLKLMIILKNILIILTFPDVWYIVIQTGGLRLPV